MAQLFKPKPTKSFRPRLPPLTRKNGIPLLRHDPGKLPPGSQLIQKGNSSHRPSLPSSRTKNATPIPFGTEIYMYSHIYTNQILYSLTRHLSNTRSMTQLAYFGKKTRPAHLRKDLWMPVCMATFPTPSAGNEAYRKLQEYKNLHETSYPEELITEKEGIRKGQLMVKKKRAKIIMDQKANSIADLAEVLRQWCEKPPSLQKDMIEEITEDMHKKRKTKIKLRNMRVKAQRERTLKRNRGRIERWEQLEREVGEEKAGPRPLDSENEERTLEGVEIRWADLRDAEFVESWPKEVVHDLLQRSRYTAAWPPKEREEEEELQDIEDGDEAKDPGPELKDLDAEKPWYRRLI